MAISTGAISVGTTATIIDGTYNSNFQLIVHNNDNTDAVYLGGADVTISTGLKLDKGQFLQLNMNPLDSVYAVSGKTGHTISFMKQV